MPRSMISWRAAWDRRLTKAQRVFHLARWLKNHWKTVRLICRLNLKQSMIRHEDRTWRPSKVGAQFARCRCREVQTCGRCIAGEKDIKLGSSLLEIEADKSLKERP